jgi:hypothetical protein
MAAPRVELNDASPFDLIDARVLFESDAIRQRSCGSLARLDTGRLLLAFRLGTGPDRANDGAVMLSHSDDDGFTWDEARPIYAVTGSDSIPMGGLVRYSDDRIRLVVGYITNDPSLGGEEPIAAWSISMTESRDGGQSWSAVGPEISLFPEWTELYGASNPHPVEGGHIFAMMGTLGRDVGWHAGVSFTPDFGDTFEPPVIIAQAPDRDYSDIDVVRLADGRFLAVVREHLTRQSIFSHSSDEGRTWSPIRPTPFIGANFKLHRLPTGEVVCAYRDYDAERPGVSLSVTADGGETWRFAGQLYAANPALDDVAGKSGLPCGYPDFIDLGGDRVGCVLHPYRDSAGKVDLHWLELRLR